MSKGEFENLWITVGEIRDLECSARVRMESEAKSESWRLLLAMQIVQKQCVRNKELPKGLEHRSKKEAVSGNCGVGQSEGKQDGKVRQETKIVRGRDHKALNGDSNGEGKR